MSTLMGFIAAILPLVIEWYRHEKVSVVTILGGVRSAGPTGLSGGFIGVDQGRYRRLRGARMTDLSATVRISDLADHEITPIRLAPSPDGCFVLVGDETLVNSGGPATANVYRVSTANPTSTSLRLSRGSNGGSPNQPGDAVDMAIMNNDDKIVRPGHGRILHTDLRSKAFGSNSTVSTSISSLQILR